MISDRWQVSQFPKHFSSSINIEAECVEFISFVFWPRAKSTKDLGETDYTKSVSRDVPKLEGHQVEPNFVDKCDCRDIRWGSTLVPFLGSWPRSRIAAACIWEASLPRSCLYSKRIHMLSCLSQSWRCRKIEASYTV